MKKGPKRSRTPAKDRKLLAAYDEEVSLAKGADPSLIPALAKRLYREDKKAFGPSAGSLEVHIRRLVDRRAALPTAAASPEPSLLELASAEKTE